MGLNSYPVNNYKGWFFSYLPFYMKKGAQPAYFHKSYIKGRWAACDSLGVFWLNLIYFLQPIPHLWFSFVNTRHLLNLKQRPKTIVTMLNFSVLVGILVPGNVFKYNKRTVTNEHRVGSRGWVGVLIEGNYFTVPALVFGAKVYLQNLA